MCGNVCAPVSGFLLPDPISCVVYRQVISQCTKVQQHMARALHKTRHFTLGNKKLTVLMDHKPLLKILGDRELADIELFQPTTTVAISLLAS